MPVVRAQSSPSHSRCLQGRSVGFQGVSTSVVLVPGAPVLVPELAGAAADDTARFTAGLVDLLAGAAADAREVAVWGCDPTGRTLGDMRSSLRRWGADVTVGGVGPARAIVADAPDAALLGWWFLDRAGIGLPRSFVGVGPDAAYVPGPREHSLVVVVADGPASLTDRAPVPSDPRGVTLDTRLTDWLGAGGRLPDPGRPVADEVGWWSRDAWLALAALVGDRPAEDSVSCAPFGVGYHGARWIVPAGGGTDPGNAE